MAINDVSRIIEEIRKCKEKGLSYPALFMGLSIPDVCGKIKYPELAGIRKTKERYLKWFDEFIDPIHNPIDYAFPDSNMKREFDGKACYELRCAMLHAAETDIGKKTDVDKFVIDFLPFAGGILYSENLDYIPEKNSEGVYEWRRKKKIYINALALVDIILEAYEKSIEN